jgi:hypothetical protein
VIGPYVPLFFQIIETVIEFQKDIGIFPQKIQLDFDDQGKIGLIALDWYARMWSESEPLRFGEDQRMILEGTPRMLNDRDYVPLQAADMLAGAVRIKLDDPRRDPGVLAPDFSWVYEELYPDILGGLTFCQESWDAIFRQLGFGPVTPSQA